MLFILLPAYNEEKGIGKLLDDISIITSGLSLDYKVIVVNDGSLDRTVDVVKSRMPKMPIELIDFKVNQGITHVFRAGFKEVCKIGADNDICITMDSDNTQDPNVIKNIIEKISQSYDVIIASRFQKGGKVIGAPLARKIMSLIVAFMLRLLIPIQGVRDYSAFYRGYKVGILKKGFAMYGEKLIDGEGFSAIASMLIKLRRVASKFGEVPLVLRYDLKESRSSIKFMRTIRGYLIIFWQIITGKL